MPKNSVTDWDTTAANNSDIGGLALAEGVAAVTEINDMFREMMKQIAVFIDAPTLGDITMTGDIKENIYTITDGAAFEIDPGNGTIQVITLGANRTPKATNFENGESILLLVNDGTSYTLTWTDATFGASGVDWKDNASAPSLDASRLTGIILWKYDGQVYGVNAGTFAV